MFFFWSHPSVLPDRDRVYCTTLFSASSLNHFTIFHLGIKKYIQTNTLGFSTHEGDYGFYTLRMLWKSRSTSLTYPSIAPWSLSYTYSLDQISVWLFPKPESPNNPTWTRRHLATMRQHPKHLGAIPYLLIAVLELRGITTINRPVIISPWRISITKWVIVEVMTTTISNQIRFSTDNFIMNLSSLGPHMVIHHHPNGTTLCLQWHMDTAQCVCELPWLAREGLYKWQA